MTFRVVLTGFGFMLTAPMIAIVWPAFQPLSILGVLVGFALVAGGGADGTLPRQI